MNTATAPTIIQITCYLPQRINVTEIYVIKAGKTLCTNFTNMRMLSWVVLCGWDQCRILSILLSIFCTLVFTIHLSDSTESPATLAGCGSLNFESLQFYSLIFFSFLLLFSCSLPPFHENVVSLLNTSAQPSLSIWVRQLNHVPVKIVNIFGEPPKF